MFSSPSKLHLHCLYLLAFGCDQARSHNARDALVSAPVRAYIEALCGNDDRCGRVAFEACVQRRLITCRPEWAEIDSADLPTLDACLDALGEQSCIEPRAISACNAVRQVLNPNARITSVAPAGAACGATTSCAAGSYCRGGSPTACGVCEPRREAGAPCAGEPGACSGFCDVDSGLCASFREIGEACPFYDQCGPGAECVEGTCREPRLGEPCNFFCSDDSICREGHCFAPKQEGDACAGLLDCGVPFVCSEGRCQRPAQCGTGQLGDACADFSCESPLACREGVCIELRPRRLGQSCDALRDLCEAGALCMDSVCEAWNPQGAIGAACEGDGDCLEGTVCDDGRCRWGEPLCPVALR